MDSVCLYFAFGVESLTGETFSLCILLSSSYALEGEREGGREGERKGGREGGREGERGIMSIIIIIIINLVSVKVQ